MAIVIDGKRMADGLLERVAADIAGRGQRGLPRPALAVILVGGDPASQIYVGRKLRACARVGITSHEFRLDPDVTEGEVVALIDRLNADPEVDGILVQLPLPAHVDANAILDRIVPDKDVDGFHPVNVGRLSTGKGHGLVPCTPLGCMLLLDSVVPEFRGLDAVVIGKSNIVGKPVALMLLERECTVTVTHIATQGLPEIVRKADIVVVAAGHPGLVRGDWAKPGAVVIDVGINRIALADGSTRIVGDVCSAEMDHAGALTPVPGGVGPMTVACLMANTLAAALGHDAERELQGAVRPALSARGH
ncbi:methylenetetrahydrofolate dehydrogenase (NADP+) / methenyltetrahydrofolate cyclohydrolase [Novosphingobium sp. CF614]|uniref:bifunctional methylenetetrahydrofolate dehydrogenase/methenyltetrahydrofolate cyclohydrolase FolD n=1 Tax=Novosphingobium sp. CF614 TaxID=1884364 RepID=UPI0008ED7674|nr:bifunctional methylenetetrahydrofolate dehydrogenase/methenyltetrahydrofolate cyclohydrolase FolD [Novosphingobium sp. CF614]SFG45937.1 methylenetetrahydrofolate dehydrogenase (NADP+) / methenyltetrahydrofolate cyclohydrolase [Novosphingobium sp. CF614]